MSGPCALLILAIACVGWGLLSLFSTDTVWSLQEQANARKGLASERTDAWESDNKLRGLISLGIGANQYITHFRWR